MDAQSEYLKAVGAATLREQLAAQEQQTPRDTVTEQRIRTQNILYQRRRAAEQREIEQAQERERATQQADAKEREEQQQRQAVLLVSQQRERELANWKSANLPVSDFEQWWQKKRLPEWQAEQAAGYSEAYKAAWLKRYGEPF